MFDQRSRFIFMQSFDMNTTPATQTFELATIPTTLDTEIVSPIIDQTQITPDHDDHCSISAESYHDDENNFTANGESK